ncbi:DUF1853 family protein [Flavobacterium sp. F-380]|uniref:DUF1853 family protein n=1 Tax=Flavobacterium kayseriense TaxID=2764714 RepID=A0ABR7JB61_9FLAO|nr:DUF1853 family protein [Flavobacterium kayseriense]MBC5842437.1 DUF1853 family protein [Flavobacterium kayseriense]MBC5848967.1 DUF1853 family protein [Flavobacterium kayseriense]
MKKNSRITSILKATSLDFSVTGIASFNLSSLDVSPNLELAVPTNIRLGHVVEKIVAELIRSSSNYNLLYENIQIIDDKKTIGEIDFIIEEHISKQVIHLELAYKFYLFDPTISVKPINNWIGPNRNDSLIEKLDKLKTTQLPLLYHERTKSTLNKVDIDKISQALCLLVSLYVPFEYNEQINTDYQKGIKGYYLNLERFIANHQAHITYYLPAKKEWGIEPADNDTWHEFDSIEKNVLQHMQEKQAPLCWQNNNGRTSQFFIVWW